MPFPDADLALILHASGYRRVSHAHCLVARADKNAPLPHGADYYRRCTAKHLTVPREVCKLMRTSSGDRTAYVKEHHQLADALAQIKATLKEKPNARIY